MEDLMVDMLSGSIFAMVCAGLFALGLGVLGAVLILLYFRNKQKAKASETWPSTSGRIISTDIRVDEYDDDDDSFKVRYVPVVQYEYQVGEENFEGKRIAFGSDLTFVSRGKAQQFLEKYPQDQEVDVFYNPEKPKESVLAQKMRSMTAALIVGIVLIALMICFLCPVSFGAVDLLFAGM
jgi:hypothetical protein